MKHEAKSKACRLDLSVSELELLLHLARTGTAPTLAKSMMPAIVSGLSLALAAQQTKVSDARSAAALRRSRSAGPDKRYDRSLIIDGHNVSARRDDYVNAGTLDYDHWQSLPFLEAMNKVPVQAEVRRDVWLVRVSTTDEQRAAHDRMFVGTDLTPTNDPREIEAVARRIINEEN